MTTLRRAASRLLGLDSAPVWILAVLLVAATSPAWASHGGGGHGGGGGGGGHSGGGGGHASGGSHAGGGGGHFSGGHASGGAAHFSGGAPMSSGRFGTPRGGGSAPGFSPHAFRPAGPGGSGGRTAVPGRPGNFRQPDGFRERGDRDHGGFRGGRGDFGHDRFFFGGGIGFGFGYDPFLWGWFPYAPYWGPSYWANLYYPYYPSYGWDYGYYPPYPSYPPEAYGAPPSGNYSGGGDDYGPPSSGESRDYRKHANPDRDHMGAVEIGVSPRDTQVYLNGQYIGIAEDFDGWPQYLWLEPGTYDIVFYHEGYKTLARQVTVYAGQRITYDDKLERGQAIRPEDLPAKTHERRDERMRFEAERNRRLSSGASGAPGAGEGSDWHDRVRGRRGDDRADRDERTNGAGGQPVAAMPGAPGGTTAPPMSDAAASDRGGQARLHLTIEPEDASVYLDGRFLGTAADINERGDGLVVGAGKHRLAVVRPGRKAEERELNITPGNDLDVDVKLERLQR
jgi:hypothetical protein